MALWLYLLSDEGGSWPVLKERPLALGLLLCDGKILAEFFGRYEDRAAPGRRSRGSKRWSGGYARPTPPDGPESLT